MGNDGKGKPPLGGWLKAGKKVITGSKFFMDERQARKHVVTIQRERREILTRIRSMKLFTPDLPGVPEPGADPKKKVKGISTRDNVREDDHPTVQMIYQLRTELDRIPFFTLNINFRRTRVMIISKIADMVRDLTGEAHAAAKEIVDMISARESMEQRKLEHAEKMQILRNRMLGSAQEMSDAELETEARKLMAPRSVEMRDDSVEPISESGL